MAKWVPLMEGCLRAGLSHSALRQLVLTRQVRGERRTTDGGAPRWFVDADSLEWWMRDEHAQTVPAA